MHSICYSLFLDKQYLFLKFLHKIMRWSFFPFPLKKKTQIEKEVSEAMMKSLKYCDVDSVSARQPLCQYRAATIHHRLASMYHSCLRNQVLPFRFSPLRSVACLAFLCRF